MYICLSNKTFVLYNNVLYYIVLNSLNKPTGCYEKPRKNSYSGHVAGNLEKI